VRFVATNSSRKYTVYTFDGKQKCETPCTLYLPPGNSSVLRVTGDATFSDKVNVRAEGGTYGVHRQSVGLVRGGQIVVIVGTAGLSIESAATSGNVPLVDIVLWLVVDVVGLTLWACAGGNGFDTMRSRTATAPRNSPVLHLSSVGVAPDTHGGGQLTAGFAF